MTKKYHPKRKSLSPKSIRLGTIVRGRVSGVTGRVSRVENIGVKADNGRNKSVTIRWDKKTLNRGQKEFSSTNANCLSHMSKSKVAGVDLYNPRKRR